MNIPPRNAPEKERGNRMPSITVFISEIPEQVPAGITAYQLRDARRPGADIVIFNGAAITEDRVLREHDSLVFITRGDIPGPHEFQACMTARHTPGVHKRLARAVVGIAGLGGLGSAVAIALARLGIGSLVLADFDVVEPSNLNRQQYYADQLGMLKTKALGDTLTRINPYGHYETHPVRLTRENIPAIFRTCDIIVEAFDLEEEKSMLVETVLNSFPRVPVVAASGMAGHGSANTITTRKVGARLYVCGDTVSASKPGCGLMAPRVGVTAHHQANLVLRLLLGEEDG